MYCSCLWCNYSFLESPPTSCLHQPFAQTSIPEGEERSRYITHAPCSKSPKIHTASLTPKKATHSNLTSHSLPVQVYHKDNGNMKKIHQTLPHCSPIPKPRAQKGSMSRSRSCDQLAGSLVENEGVGYKQETGLLLVPRQKKNTPTIV